MKFYNLTCAWSFIAHSTLLNIEWPDGNSQFYPRKSRYTKRKSE